MKFVQPHRMDILPNDPRIAYPLLSNTISVAVLLVLAIVIPFVAIGLLGLYKSRRMLPTKRDASHALLALVFSAAANDSLTEILKKLVGRPRPNFVQLAGYQPDGTFAATAANVREAFQSFPSGHTSMAFAGLLFFSLFIWREIQQLEFYRFKVHHQSWGSLKIVLSAGPTVLAAYIGATRITDYWHNFDDVVAGAFLGSVIACVAFFTQYVPYTVAAASLSASSSSSLSGNHVLPITMMGDLHQPAGGSSELPYSQLVSVSTTAE